MEKLVYLAGDTQLEPLWNQWYVCLPMLAPVPAAMLLKKQYLKIMDSYITSPEDHISLSKDSSMVGGPFVTYENDRSSEVRLLRDRTLKDQQHLIEFANAIDTFNDYLIKNTDGYSLIGEYQKIPPILRGYIELTYDMNDHASVRFIEGLLYKSEFYARNKQSICVSKIEKDKRGFVLSTPRLPSDGQLLLNVQFNSENYDFISEMRETPKRFSEVSELFDLSQTEKKDFAKYFVERSSSLNCDNEITNGIRIRYFGHACVLVEYNKIAILTDPFISYQYQTDIPRYTIVDLPKKIDYVLITHGHLDHIVLETLLQIRYKIGTIVVPKSGGTNCADISLKLLLQELGFSNVYELDELEKIVVNKDISINTFPFLGEHHDLMIRTKLAYLVKVNNKKIYFAADSANLDEYMYKHIHEITSDIDYLFLGMECHGAPISWFYGPLFSRKLDRDKNYSRPGSGSDFEQAIKIVAALKAKNVCIYAMGMEPWLSYVLGLAYTENSVQIKESNKLLERCAELGLAAERLFGKKQLII